MNKKEFKKLKAKKIELVNKHKQLEKQKDEINKELSKSGEKIKEISIKLLKRGDYVKTRFPDDVYEFFKKDKDVLLCIRPIDKKDLYGLATKKEYYKYWGI